MSIVLFLRGMLVALAVYFVTSLYLGSSMLSAFLQTCACAALIQLGYFVCILFLVWRHRPPTEPAASRQAEAPSKLGVPDENSAEPAVRPVWRRP